MIYQLGLKIDAIFPREQADKVLTGILAIKKDFPQANITYIEVRDDTITVEFYDHPVIPIALILVAVIAAIVVIGLSIVDKTVSRILEAVGNLPGPVQSFLAVGIAVAAAGVGMSLVASQVKPSKKEK